MGGVIWLWLQWLYSLAHGARWAFDGALDCVIASSWWLN